MTETAMTALMLPLSALTPLLPAQVVAGGRAAGETAKTVADTAVEPGGLGGWLVLLAVVLTIAVPILLGWLIAKALRLPDLATRIGVVLLAVFIGASPFVWNVIVGTSQGYGVRESLAQSLRLGIDLAGGTNLVYQVLESSDPDKRLDDNAIDKAVGAIVQRINPSGTEEVIVRKVGKDRIEVIVPGADREKVGQIKNRLTRLGSLEFAIFANRRDHESLIAAGENLPGSERNVRIGGRVAAAWKSVARDADGKWKEEPRPGVEVERFVNKAGEVVRAPEGEGLKAGADLDRQILVVLDPEEKRVTGQGLRVSPTMNQDTGRPSVAFSFDARGGRRLQALSTANRPGRDGFKRRMAILLDDRVHSAPNLNDVISTRGEISGSFSQDEVNELVNVLNAGALEVTIDPSPVSEFTISPLLGKDTIRKSVAAILWSGLLVFLFMAFYYWKAGLVADLCLVLNIILVLGTMSFVDATFTLPGLAGIVLTIGMAVDANVLIFERIREETERGGSLRLAIANGFDRAFSTIIDANVTTLIVAIILFLIGTDAVRGFAVTLFVGIVMSMFTAIYVGRLILEVLERKGMRRLNMASAVGHTRFRFMGKAVPVMAGSGLLIAGGLAVLFLRGPAMLDIDFLGGTMVTFQLKPGQTATATQVRSVLEAVPEFKGNVSVERLVLAGEPAGDAGSRFRARTTMRDETLRVEANPNSPPATPGAVQPAGRTVSELVAGAFQNSQQLDILRVFAKVGPVESVPGEAAEGSFAGGRRATVSLSQELGADTVAAYLGRQLSAPAGGGKRYDEPEGLIRVVGTGGTGLTAAETEARTFDAVRIEAAPVIAEADFKSALAGMKAVMVREPVFDEVNSFDSSVAGEMQESALLAVFASWLAIIGYLWFRFQNIAFGLAAVAALVHDVLFTLGAVAVAAAAGAAGVHVLGIEEFKINLAMVAAVLTLIGYSINDTIVVFDRIRETRGKSQRLTPEIIDASLNATLSRTVLTGVTTLIVVAILYFFGGEGVHGFAFVLTIGIIVGTYSSIYIASPILLWLVNRGQTQPTPAVPVRQPLSR